MADAEPVPTTASTQPDALPDPSAGLAGPPSAQGMPVDNRTPPPQPQPAPPSKQSFLSSILHAVGDALGGPKTGETGQPISTAARVLHGVGTIAQGVAAGAAQHGPGSIGQSALAGAQVEQKQAQQEKDNTLANRKQSQEELMNKATMAYHNNQMLLQQREADRMDTELRSKIGDANRSFETMVQEKGWQKPPILVNGEDINGKPGNEADMMKYFSGPGSHKAPDGYVYSYLPTEDDKGKITHAVYLAPVNSMDQMVTLDKAAYKAQTGIDAPGTNFTEKLGDLINQRSIYAKSQLEGAQEARQKEESDRANKLLPGQISQQKAELRKTNAEAAKASAEAKKAKSETWGDENKSGSDFVQSLDPGQRSMVEEIGTGKMALNRLDYLASKKPEVLEAVAKAYPDFDSSKVAAYTATYKDFTSGPTSKTLNAGGTALIHLRELHDLNTAASHIPHTPAWTAYQNKADTVASELAKFYGDATIPGISAIKSTLSSTLPGNRGAAIQTQLKSMGDKLDQFDQQWKNAAPSAVYQAPLPGVSVEAKNARAALDPEYAKRVMPPGPQSHQFSPSAWKAANPNGDVNAAIEAAQRAKYTITQ